MKIFELKNRLLICKVLLEHLQARKETRWHSFAENLDYPAKDSAFEKYINSRLENGIIKIISRPLVKRGDKYEHQYFKYISDLVQCGFTEQYIKNLAVNPDQNLDHMTAYIIVFHRFKKVSPGGTVSLVEARNVFDFYKSILCTRQKKTTH